MEYEGICRKLLDDVGAGIGDMVKLSSGNDVQEGRVMPRHMLTGSDILVLKLSSGYNVGLRVGSDSRLVLVGKALYTKPERNISGPSGLPRVSFISTGGTIASYVDYKTGAVHPAVEAQDILFSVPELAGLCEVKSRILASILSENMNPGLWMELANAVVEEFNSGSRGVVIPHGTDTLGYTSAALSFLLQDLPGPVVLVGSQRSSDRPSSDASMNLLAAAKTSLADFGDVVVVMHDSTSDTRCAIHHGTRVRKMHTSRRDAFRSVNTPVMGYVDDGLTFMEPVKPAGAEAVVGGDMESDVVLVHAYPGITPGRFADMVRGAKGVVIAGTGLGHISSDILPAMKAMVEEGVLVVMASQCLWGTTNLNVYSTGRELLKVGVVPCGDMLPETALVKLMWSLGSSKTSEEARELMTSNIAGEISQRITLEDGP